MSKENTESNEQENVDVARTVKQQGTIAEAVKDIVVEAEQENVDEETTGMDSDETGTTDSEEGTGAEETGTTDSESEDGTEGDGSGAEDLSGAETETETETPNAKTETSKVDGPGCKIADIILDNIDGLTSFGVRLNLNILDVNKRKESVVCDYLKSEFTNEIKVSGIDTVVVSELNKKIAQLD